MNMEKPPVNILQNEELVKKYINALLEEIGKRGGDYFADEGEVAPGNSVFFRQVIKTLAEEQGVRIDDIDAFLVHKKPYLRKLTAMVMKEREEQEHTINIKAEDPPETPAPKKPLKDDLRGAFMERSQPPEED